MRKCYENRKGVAFTTLKRLAGQGETRRLDFERLYDLLCKLGQHVYTAKKLIEAAVSLSQDFMDGFCIKALPSSKEQKLPLLPKEATIESTIRRMFSSAADQSQFMARLQFIWDPSELSELLQKQHKTKTRVHAELILLDHFDKHGLNFLDNDDKYIGCSKPACYLCYAYITHHPGRYAVPPSHQKLYMGWRHPDVDPNAIKLKAQQEHIMLKLIEWVRRDIRTDIESRTKRHPYHADTAGMSSLSRTLALNALSVHDIDTHRKLHKPNIKIRLRSVLENPFLRVLRPRQASQTYLTPTMRAVFDWIRYPRLLCLLDQLTSRALFLPTSLWNVIYLLRIRL